MNKHCPPVQLRGAVLLKRACRGFLVWLAAMLARQGKARQGKSSVLSSFSARRVKKCLFGYRGAITRAIGIRIFANTKRGGQLWGSAMQSHTSRWTANLMGEKHDFGAHKVAVVPNLGSSDPRKKKS
ncbi:hypothetical protein MCOR27_011176 [Pyricularia oryzae]|uniref:Ribosomal protein S19 n=1 Tax=Pyricularia grisea TaxID=148305 RepID=A0ABQ8NQR5_PYRGI|nr:hypothetical protein MCOR01_004088 [Pyricularia oryzae]KAI6300611.1 hypothetical protein MCOR33_003643 [Pyricularia grisea]KAI6266020.1 hypothetical protein MCOR27_011176 [Pyricularia oryzae]KAI6308011.1 hypothetical protein MCOR29_009443 [Pyricularia oryzae]KAI6419326.1 hypothetical protein MCOR22_011771 [Pyricularia oryzae]